MNYIKIVRRRPQRKFFQAVCPTCSRRGRDIRQFERNQDGLYPCRCSCGREWEEAWPNEIITVKTCPLCGTVLQAR